MNVQTRMQDMDGLTKVAPLSRRGFMTASAASAAGFTLAAGPVRALRWLLTRVHSEMQREDGTFRGDGVSSEEIRCAGAIGHWRTADAFQSPRVGRSEWPRGER